MDESFYFEQIAEMGGGKENRKFRAVFNLGGMTHLKNGFAEITKGSLEKSNNFFSSAVDSFENAKTFCKDDSFKSMAVSYHQGLCYYGLLRNKQEEHAKLKKPSQEEEMRYQKTIKKYNELAQICLQTANGLVEQNQKTIVAKLEQKRATAETQLTTAKKKYAKLTMAAKTWARSAKKLRELGKKWTRSEESVKKAQAEVVAEIEKAKNYMSNFGASIHYLATLCCEISEEGEKMDIDYKLKQMGKYINRMNDPDKNKWRLRHDTEKAFSDIATSEYYTQQKDPRAAKSFFALAHFFGKQAGQEFDQMIKDKSLVNLDHASKLRLWLVQIKLAKMLGGEDQKLMKKQANNTLRGMLTKPTLNSERKQHVKKLPEWITARMQRALREPRQQLPSKG